MFDVDLTLEVEDEEGLRWWMRSRVSESQEDKKSAEQNYRRTKKPTKEMVPDLREEPGPD